MILVLSHPNDIHAACVLDHLSELGAPARLLDLSTFPRQTQLTIEAGGAVAGEVNWSARFDLDPPLALDEVGAVWWRRPQPLSVHGEITRPSHRGFAYNECVEALAGLWQALDVAWVNHPTRDEVAARKALQLQLAQRCGLAIPRTCITSNPDTARAFIVREGLGRTICKSFSATHADWRETRIVGAAEMMLLESVRAAPVIFQQYIEAEVDLRITMVGEHCFPAAIHSQDTRYAIDFRMDMQRAEVESALLPEPVLAGLRKLMRELGLVYGAIDMRRTPAGEHVFLEVNPAGQFLFVEEKSGQPIAHTLARVLARSDRRVAARPSGNVRRLRARA